MSSALQEGEFKDIIIVSNAPITEKLTLSLVCVNVKMVTTKAQIPLAHLALFNAFVVSQPIIVHNANLNLNEKLSTENVSVLMVMRRLKNRISVRLRRTH